MNIFNKFFLFMVLLPAAFYKKMGVHLPHLRAILNAKLLMDDRRVSTIQQTRKRKNAKPPKDTTIGTMIMTAILGAIFLISFTVGNDYLTQLTIYFALYIFTLTSVLISDFTSVLIDVRDNLILLPKPINDKTFVLARLLHIVIHVSKMVMPMALPGLILISYREGWRGGLPFLLVVISATLFTIFVINAVYLFILKITTPEKFKNVISYFQIFFAVGFYGGYQLVPKLISKTVLQSYSIIGFKYAWVVIPYWFAGGWQFTQDFIANKELWYYFILTLLLPFVSIWAVIKYFAPSFNRKLSMISGSETGTAPVQKNGKRVSSTTPGYITVLSKLVTGKGTEHMSFMQTWKITGRSRDFKLKVYPSIGYLAVYLVLIFFDRKRNGDAGIKMPDMTFFFTSIIYFSSFVLIQAISQLAYSDKYKAAWIYFITPIAVPGKLLSGAMKAMIVKYYLPLVVTTFTLALVMAGPSILPNLLLAIFNQLLITAFTSYLMMRDLPFSTQQTNNIKGSVFLKGLLSMLLPVALAVMHIFIYKYTIVVLILCVLSLIAAWMMMDALKNKSWEKVWVKEYEG